MASCASFAETGCISKHLTCSICLEIFKVPKTLSCLHTFCESCLDKHICQTTGSSVPQDSFECPLCRANITPNGGLPKEQWAKQFPTNHMIVSLLDDEHIKFQSKYQPETETILNCNPCIIDGKETGAFGYCLNCNEYLCKTCFEEHRKFKSTRRHAVLTGAELPIDTSGFVKASQLIHCSIHSTEKLEYKCGTHHAFLCSICAMSSHRECNGIEYIGSTASHKLNLAVDIPLLQEDIQNQIDANLKVVEKIGSFASDAGNHISDVKNETQRFIAHLDVKINRRLKTFVEQEKQKLTEALQTLFSVNGKLTQVNSVIKVAEKYGSEIPTAILQEWIDGVRNEAKQLEHVDSEANLSLLEHNISDEVEVLQKFVHENIMCKLNALSIPKDFPICQSSAQSPVSDESERQSPDTMSNNEYPYDDIHEVNSVESDGDQDEIIDLDTVSLMDCDIYEIGRYDLEVSAHASRPCCHNGSLLLSDGRMILIDKANMLIKVVTEDFRVKCYKTLEDAPLDICLLSGTKIAVVTTSSVFILDIKSELESPVLQSKLHSVRSLCLIKGEVWMLCADHKTEFKVVVADSKFKIIDERNTFTSWLGTDTTLRMLYGTSLSSLWEIHPDFI